MGLHASLSPSSIDREQTARQSVSNGKSPGSAGFGGMAGGGQQRCAAHIQGSDDRAEGQKTGPGWVLCNFLCDRQRLSFVTSTGIARALLRSEEHTSELQSHVDL